MSKPVLFTGAGVAIITPFNEDQSVNYEKFTEIVEYQLEKGTDAIVVCGTTGEAKTLSTEEHVKLIKLCVDVVNHKVPVIAGAGSNDTHYAVKLSNEAESCGVDAILSVTPYYNKTSQRGLITHYNYIADRVKTPIILYNVPSRTGVNIEPSTYEALKGYPNITAIKEANGNISKIVETFSLIGEEMDLYSGNDDQIVPILSMGGSGVISVLSNLMPKETVKMCELCFTGDYKAAAKMQMDYLPLINALFCEVNPIPVKAAMAAMGYCDNYVRLPLIPMSKDKEAKLLDIMKGHGLI